MGEWNKKRKVVRHYDRLAKIYDSQYAAEQEAKIKAALSDLHLKPNSLVLDLGCGTGLLFEHIGNSVRLLVGIDISACILNEAKKRAKKFQNVALIRAEVDYVPFLSQTFDSVFAITLLQNTPNPTRTLEEIERITKQNATIILTGLKKEFTLETFKQLLKNTQLSIQTIKTNNKLKDYIVTCNNLMQTLLKPHLKQRSFSPTQPKNKSQAEKKKQSSFAA